MLPTAAAAVVVLSPALELEPSTISSPAFEAAAMLLKELAELPVMDCNAQAGWPPFRAA